MPRLFSSSAVPERLTYFPFWTEKLTARSALRIYESVESGLTWGSPGCPLSSKQPSSFTPLYCQVIYFQGWSVSYSHQLMANSISNLWDFKTVHNLLVSLNASSCIYFSLLRARVTYCCWLVWPYLRAPMVGQHPSGWRPELWTDSDLRGSESRSAHIPPCCWPPAATGMSLWMKEEERSVCLNITKEQFQWLIHRPSCLYSTV